MPPKTKVKTVEVSAKSFFGLRSQMDRTIEKFTEKGWVHVDTIPGRKDKYLLTFEYHRKRGEIAGNAWEKLVVLH